MNQVTVGSQKMAGDIAPILLDTRANIDGNKVTDLLVCGDKRLVQKFSYAWV